MNKRNFLLNECQKENSNKVKRMVYKVHKANLVCCTLKAGIIFEVSSVERQEKTQLSPYALHNLALCSYRYSFKSKLRL